MTPLSSIAVVPPPRTQLAWRAGETSACRLIEDRGYAVHDANIIFQANCANIDLVVYGRTAATYVQVKTSRRPAGRDCVVVDGSGWTSDQLYAGAPVFNRHPGLAASVVMILDHRRDGSVGFYLAPVSELTDLLLRKAVPHAQKPKRDGQPRSIAFRKELEREHLEQWADRWDCLGEAAWA